MYMHTRVWQHGRVGAWSDRIEPMPTTRNVRWLSSGGVRTSVPASNSAWSFVIASTLASTSTRGESGPQIRTRTRRTIQPRSIDRNSDTKRVCRREAGEAKAASMSDGALQDTGGVRRKEARKWTDRLIYIG